MKKYLNNPIISETLKSLLFINIILIGLILIKFDTNTPEPISDYFFIASSILFIRTLLSAAAQSGSLDILKFGMRKIFNMTHQSDFADYKDSIEHKQTYSLPKYTICFVYFLVSFLIHKV